MKFPVFFPMRGEQDYGTDRFTLQLYDRDLIGSDTFIGDCMVDLNMHRMIAKACKRMTPCQMLMRNIDEGGAAAHKIWLDVYHPKEKDAEGKKVS